MPFRSISNARRRGRLWGLDDLYDVLKITSRIVAILRRLKLQDVK